MTLEARITEAHLTLLGVPATDARIEEAHFTVLGQPQTDARIFESAFTLLAFTAPCVAERCQLWTITRRDGQVFRFTSRDVDVQHLGHTYKACASLSPTASEDAAEADQVGNMELSGILSDDAISERDLYAGLFDDAQVEVWRVDIADSTDIPRRLAAGWTGEVSQGEQGWKTEVLGPGARLQQKPLLKTVTPGCSRRFGDGATGCPVDREALKTTGAVTRVTDRARFVTDAADPMVSAQWPRGDLRWTSGDNAGITCEVQSVDFGTGAIVLWQPAPFRPAVGDTFDLLPGCDLAFATCKTTYGVGVSFGGFKDVPGGDKLKATPDVKE